MLNCVLGTTEFIHRRVKSVTRAGTYYSLLLDDSFFYRVHLDSGVFEVSFCACSRFYEGLEMSGECYLMETKENYYA